MASEDNKPTETPESEESSEKRGPPGWGKSGGSNFERIGPIMAMFSIGSNVAFASGAGWLVKRYIFKGSPYPITLGVGIGLGAGLTSVLAKAQAKGPGSWKGSNSWKDCDWGKGNKSQSESGQSWGEKAFNEALMRAPPTCPVSPYRWGPPGGFYGNMQQPPWGNQLRPNPDCDSCKAAVTALEGCEKCTCCPSCGKQQSEKK